VGAGAVVNEAQNGPVRLSLRGAGILERLALRVGLVPAPAAEAWGGMALAGVLVAAVRLGVTARLAAGPATVDQLCAELGLAPIPTRLLLECLRSGRHVVRRGSTYRLSAGSRRWLDPASPVSVSHFVAANGDYWSWWERLPEVARTGQPIHPHAAGPDDPYWRRYLYGQRDLARLSAGEVAAKVRVPAGARTLLDIGGGHGWYAAQLCQRHPTLSATVLDLPGSSRIGREIMAEAGRDDRVRHRDGDALTADLGGPYDVVCCFNLVHHLAEPDIVRLFTRVRAALAPGGTFAVLDGFVDEGRGSAAADVLGLFMYLSSGAEAYPEHRIHDWFAQAGFAASPRRSAIRRIPGLTLYQTAAP
jgi:SAM-dependent methyltransferase